MRIVLLHVLALLSVLTAARTFSVNDDVFAFPQYDVTFSESYIIHEDALAILESYRQLQDDSITRKDGDVSVNISPDKVKGGDSIWQHMILQGLPYLCEIPSVHSKVSNVTEPETSAEEEEKELMRATDRGLQLLQDMEGKQCLFYSTGWWTYSFCYNSQIKQFHALSPGTGGAKVWPPQEDPTTPSYVLGKFEQKQSKSTQPDEHGKHDLVELQKKADTSYLVQHLEGGTPCDLTGKNRKIEVQFHCNPQLTDRIGWIKETATCAYLMVVYTPRLCNDVAFVPPKENQANVISCREILQKDEVSDWNAQKSAEASQKMIDQGSEQRIIVGNIEVGAMKSVGQDGKKLERGRIVLTQEERAEIIVMQKGGEISSISNAELKKLDINPDELETFRKELQKLAGDKDWKIERLDDVHGHVQLRGIVTQDDEDEESVGKQEEPLTDTNEKIDTAEGSEEEYKDET